jgi:hypothetical protein
MAFVAQGDLLNKCAVVEIHYWTTVTPATCGDCSDLTVTIDGHILRLIKVLAWTISDVNVPVNMQLL